MQISRHAWAVTVAPSVGDRANDTHSPIKVRHYRHRSVYADVRCIIRDEIEAAMVTSHTRRK